MLQGLVAASTPRMRLFVGQRKEVIESMQEVIAAERPGIPLIIKDSWQYPERDEEGELLCEATAKGVVNVARYYHHETVQIHRYWTPYCCRSRCQLARFEDSVV
ncbi:hypothetical protein BKA56DRAFT_600408 [Ilyonectria sp. MPI-CAGE-AT-0026]|nr:hypothetical protein BKA56DRAFT_600408 [Ilyonectria sp. MPI-CAGE-AT-0026]